MNSIGLKTAFFALLFETGNALYDQAPRLAASGLTNPQTKNTTT